MRVLALIYGMGIGALTGLDLSQATDLPIWAVLNIAIAVAWTWRSIARDALEGEA